jgi:hypothetical protein
MNRDELAPAAAPASLVDYIARHMSHLQQMEHPHDGHGGSTSVRQATYRGHQIVIRTSYRIEVDGRPIDGHLAVTNDGRVHYHAIPNYRFASAVDLVRQLIDTFPDDFPAPTMVAEQPEHAKEL